MEIERKFLVAETPDLEGIEFDEIEQGYLALGEQGEVRLRRRAERRRLTVKLGAGMMREEAEVELELEQFEALWPLTEGRRLWKRRYELPDGGLAIELDVYGGELDGLVVAEVEFSSEAEAEAFEPPEWFGGEVTGDRLYLNQTLASAGAPTPGSPCRSQSP